ncbi:MAG: hypothetical protein Q7Q71_13710 [Verrucomicrobiota bacterium JB023]|nr:hypothetical protein [Verrucomicrobiota bacterium JB023]
MLRIPVGIAILFLVGRAFYSENSLHEPARPTILPSLVKKASALFSTSLDDVRASRGKPTPAIAEGFPPVISKATPTTGPWPLSPSLKPKGRVRLQIITEDVAKKQWAYRSKHFTFVSDAPLRTHVLREFALQFELTHQYCCKLPLALQRLHGVQTQPMAIHLIEDYEHYIARGGLPGSAGVYLSQPDVILVPFKGLGLISRHGEYALDPHRSTQTLVHEVTHMLMRGPLLQAGWFSEGAAEYVSTIPMTNDRLLIANHLASVKSYVTSYGYKGRGGHNLGARIQLTPLQEMMESDYDTFLDLPHSYPYSLLLFYFLAHMDGERDGQTLRDYVQVLHSGGDESTARKAILAGRDYKTLEKLLTNSWAQHGIYLNFGN